ncbi:hypothetical protein PP631_gp081 [Streptomyces phage KimJongPhill]|uniref:Uncharacterized protein n=1 Tax=Streptomyces phage KimJongPhill TaxID=2848886 RepID=A0A8F2E6Q9_9CAUD|nr:hypothetical protein PP631_gp081 [Streptomyces phage KimJongPhill]QWT29862.1 hypothetical protein SEA_KIMJONGPHILL_81 [Streptomyces phage KimJongPhill]
MTDPRITLRQNPQPKMPRGFYLATIEMMADSMSSGGSPMLTQRWRLVGSPTEGKPYTYLWRVPLTEVDIHKLTQVNRALGLATPSLERLQDGTDKLLTENYLGKPALVYLVPEQYQGQWRSTIREIRPQSQAIALMAVVPDEEPSL